MPMEDSGNICCICLASDLKVYSLSVKDENEFTLHSKLTICISEIEWLELYQICEQCMELLDISYTFRETCLKSDLERQKRLGIKLENQDLIEYKINQEEFIEVQDKADLIHESDLIKLEVKQEVDDEDLSEQPTLDTTDTTVPQYDDETFFMHFRVKREHTIRLAEEYQQSEQYKSQAGQHGKISPLNHILIFLWFMGHQTASFRDVADRFDITISSLHRIVRRVSVFLSNLSPNYIMWPNENEKRLIEQHFRENGFPNVIGAIDGCHIKIAKPQNDADAYMNCKGFYSVQMQVVCDNNRQIRDVFIGFPGSVHDDSRVFRNSPLSANLEQMCGRYVLLGDSAYPLKVNLLVPFKDRGQLTERQINYNIQLSKNRRVIEHTFGILKQKFRQLYHVKLRNITYIVHFIRAACVLHNICIHDEYLPAEELEVNEVIPAQIDNDAEDEEEPSPDARRTRDNFLNMVRNPRNN